MPKPRTKTRRFTTTAIPDSLMARIDAIITADKYGYQNRNDFILDAVRKRLRELGYLE
jgi:metal-responsive CopG/Arc/MetJ family transcriptional regulator